jgi:hypothetical protein
MFRKLFRSPFRNRTSACRCFRLAVERLEERCVPTTTAGLFNQGGTLWVNGSDGDQRITITQLADSTYKVEAPDLAGGPKTFKGVQVISVNTYAGNDTVLLNGNSTPLANLLTSNLTITGRGSLTVVNDHFNVNGEFHVGDNAAQAVHFQVSGDTFLGKLTIIGGNGNSNVLLQTGAFVGGPTSITLGNGFDNVTLQKGVILNGSLSISLGSGDDIVSLTGVTVGLTKAANINMGLHGGIDKVDLSDTSVNGNLTVDATGGLDEFVLNQSSIRGSVQASCGSHMVAGVVGCTLGGELKYFSHNGTEIITVHDTQIGGNFTVHSDTGGVDVRLVGATIKGDTTGVDSQGPVRFWADPGTGNQPTILYGSLSVSSRYAAANNSADIELYGVTIQRNLNLLTGAGQDRIRIEGSHIGQQKGSITNISMGSGNDTLELADDVFYSLSTTFDGGLGFNTLSRRNDKYANGVAPIIINF